jgi:hypothetical protein
MAQAIVQRYTATTTGPQAPFSAPGGAPFATYAIQVKGTGAAPSSWSVTLEGSFDRVNWSTLITHNAGDGSTQWETTGKPCGHVRANVGALTLGSATNIVVTALAVP